MPDTPRTTRARSVSQQAGTSSSPINTNTRRPMPVVELPSSRSSARNPINTSTPPKKATKSGTSTPTTVHHHKSADEVALEEAEHLLENVDVEHGDARSRRHEHLRLSRLRSQSVPAGPEVGEDVKAEVEGDDEVDEEGSEEMVSAREDLEDTPVADVQEVEITQSAPVIEEDLPTPTSAVLVERDDEDESDESSDADSDDDTSATSDSDSDSEADSDDDDAELERLLQAAKVSATKPSSQISGENVLGGDGDVVSFDQDDQEKQARREAPIPDISITKMPKPHLSFSADGSARATDAPLIIAGPSRSRSNKETKIPELDVRPYERTMSKREKAAQPRKATVSELWSTLPAPKADVLPQMRRDYQALSLANSLDPKRFMKGGNRSGKIPETFAIGTLVEAPRHLQDTTLTREKQYRPGQLVQSLTKDEDTGSYAKRKYGDLQSKRMENGRGNGWKKQRGWKP